MNRRKFLSASLQGAAATAALSTLQARAMAAMGNSRSLGVALVGLGNYATNQLAPALQETTNCHLAGIVTGTPAKEKEWASEYDVAKENIYNYETFDAIADNDAIDIIYVVLPNSMHAEYTIRAAQAGKHVICEKPMAVSVEECRRMIEACEKAGVKLSIGYRLHFDPHHQRVIELAKARELGNPRYVQAEFGFPIGDPSQWRLDMERAGGGALMDVGVYCIQGACYSTGEEPIAVSAREFKTDQKKFAEVDETIAWQMEFPSGIIANCLSSYNLSTNRLYVDYTKGKAEIEPSYSYSGLAGTINGQTLDYGKTIQQAGQMDAFAHCILQDRESSVSGKMGLRDVRILEAIYKSIREGNARIKI